LKIFIRGVMDKRSPLTQSLMRSLLKQKIAVNTAKAAVIIAALNSLAPVTPPEDRHSAPSALPRERLHAKIKLKKMSSTEAMKKSLVLSLSSLQIAQQLTLLEHSIFSEIKPSEFFHQGWAKADADRRSPNIRAAISRFNTTTKWIVASVLKEERLKSRVKVVRKFINVAKHLRALNNFHTLMAFLAGINDSPVYRLKYTRAELPPKPTRMLEELQNLMNADTNYEQYRQNLSNISESEPCIPYLGMLLRDLTYFEEDGSSSSEAGLINFKQSKNVYSVLNHIIIHQQCPYPFDCVPVVQELLKNLPVIDDEDELFKLSLLREPRAAKRSEIM